jgi:hypothetical protein
MLNNAQADWLTRVPAIHPTHAASVRAFEAGNALYVYDTAETVTVGQQRGELFALRTDDAEMVVRFLPDESGLIDMYTGNQYSFDTGNLYPVIMEVYDRPTVNFTS